MYDLSKMKERELVKLVGSELFIDHDGTIWKKAIAFFHFQLEEGSFERAEHVNGSYLSVNQVASHRHI